MLPAVEAVPFTDDVILVPPLWSGPDRHPTAERPRDRRLTFVGALCSQVYESECIEPGTGGPARDAEEGFLGEVEDEISITWRPLVITSVFASRRWWLQTFAQPSRARFSTLLPENCVSPRLEDSCSLSAGVLKASALW